ncbi:hypothetical protein [Hymenobacter pini]|uniref:hypothetical protein n=1 Tax=Hymenobacter pini TaxID=2880879 RepID=UPI001CF12AAD|nr:hypothetical protein [Hymenobacter pini]MCA8830558.1 hypothetical protein [Hymenobacter pini]
MSRKEGRPVNKPFLHIEDHLAMLNEYAPHKVTMQLRNSPDQYTLVGVNFSTSYVLLAKAGAQAMHSPLVVTPVLYSLADLPNLPGGDGRDYASPVASIIHALNFIQRGDYASGEWVNQVTVKSASDEQLHLAFSTTYQLDTSQFSADDFDQQEPTDDTAGADYEVIISAAGTVHWRCVTADNLDMGKRSPALGFTQHWRIAEGANVFVAFTMMRRLHVAVGQAAYVHRVWNSEAKGYDKHYSYVRKQLPASVQEGGQADG